MNLESDKQRIKTMVNELMTLPKDQQFSFLVAWLTAVGPDKEFLGQVVREAETAFVTLGYTAMDTRVIERYMEALLEREPSISSMQLARKTVKHFKFPPEECRYNVRLAQKIKHRIIAREWKRRNKSKNGAKEIAAGC